ncbi:glycerate kinase [Plantibacter sp. Leaf171]|uniref:glycerate kinase n=1 Tax=unclassified Plantibacter TaxID=2624265 RepID=UPI0006F87E96|nr:MULTISPECIES: glycerate kinase [unclassified Plantibacter]KQM17693.1 glycerate kinase [Plantibacter sp. Leaf1]KQR60475.1 glycerate kinase [Plantibacter sp. Leaf171]
MAPHIVIAPDSFKGTATAAEVASAIADGWRSVRPEDTVQLLPMADGGEGTLDAFAAAVPGARRHPITVTGPVGDAVEAEWLELPDGSAVVELAQTSGLTLLDPLQPFAAHTTGFGEAIAAALDHGARRLLLAIGGSSSTDGGAGLLTALGVRLQDADGGGVMPGNAGLATLDHLDLEGLRALPDGGAVILSDVTNPLLGDRGAAAVFGPQKGATAEDVTVLDANLARFASRAAAAFGAEQAERAAVEPGAGAAGGAGYGLLLWGATATSGATGVGDAIGLPAAAATASVVITGEGRFDDQTADGKVASHVAGLAPGRTMLVAGAVQAPTEGLFVDAVSLTELAGGVEAAMAEPLVHLRAAGAALAAQLRP